MANDYKRKVKNGIQKEYEQCDDSEYECEKIKKAGDEYSYWKAMWHSYRDADPGATVDKYREEQRKR